MLLGNKVVVETIKKIECGTVSTQTQETLAEGQELKPAPKISKEFCFIDWSQDCQTVYNHIRGLSPYPAAHTQLVSEEGEVIEMKVFYAQIEIGKHGLPVGSVVTDNKKTLKIALRDGFISLTKVQQAGKKAMPIDDFLRGTQLNGAWKAALK